MALPEIQRGVVFFQRSRVFLRLQRSRSPGRRDEECHREHCFRGSGWGAPLGIAFSRLVFYVALMVNEPHVALDIT